MSAITITVTIPATPQRTYRFDETPLLVGRSPECTLAICHEAVPRLLCRIWSEERGRAVRVEELPGLTNPLLCDGRRLAGGATGRRLSLAIGPIELDVRPAAVEDVSSTTRGRRARLLVAGVALVVGLLLVVLGPRRQPPREAEPGGIASLPESPLGQPTAASCDDRGGCSARAALLASRARSLLADPSVDPVDRVQATRLLERSAGMLEAIGAAAAPAQRREAERAARALDAAYRRERARLHQALARGEPTTAAQAAARLRGFLFEPDHEAARRWLDRIAAAGASGGSTP